MPNLVPYQHPGPNDPSVPMSETLWNQFLTTIDTDLDSKTTAATLLASGGSALVGFLQSGTGASTRTAQSKLREIVSVLDFGAVGDGTTTNTSAIQAAIDAVSAAGGGIVFFPSGSYRSGKLTLPQDVLLLGQGKYCSRIVATAGLNDTLINRPGTYASPINRGGVEKLTLVGSGKANTSMWGISNVYTNRGTIRDVDIHGCYVGVYTKNVWQDTWENVHVHGGGTDANYIGFYFGPRDAIVGVSNAVNAINCIAQGVEMYGWRIENCNGSKFTICEGMDGVTGWYIGSPQTGSESLEFALWESCLSDTNSSYGWRIEKGAATELKQLQFANCWAGTSGGTAVYLGGCSNLTLTNWQIIQTAGHGFHLQSSSRCSISNCNIRSYNNASGSNSGIFLQDSLVNSVTGCQIYTVTGGTGKSIVESGTSDYNILIGNPCAGGLTIVGANTVNQYNLTV